MTRPRGQAGLSLIEVLFVAAFSAVLITPIFALIFLTTNQFRPQELKNRSSSQLSLFRTHLINDWSLARTVRINPTIAQSNPALPDLPAATPALPFAKMDCRGGTHPWYASNVYPVIALHTHADGSNTGRRIVYSIRVKPNNKIDVIRRECGHLPVDGLSEGNYDYWADSCPNPAGNPLGGVCDMTTTASGVAAPTERVIIRDATELRIPVGCNNGNDAPPYLPCDANVTLVAEDGQTSTPRLHQPVVTTGRMVGGITPLYVVYDTRGRPS